MLRTGLARARLILRPRLAASGSGSTGAPRILELKRQLSRVGVEPLRSRAIQRPPASPAWPADSRSRRAARGHLDQGVGLAWQGSDVGRHGRKNSEPRRRFASFRRWRGALFSRHRHRAGANLAPVHAAEQKPQLHRVQRDRPVAHRWPSERTALQALGDRQARTRPRRAVSSGPIALSER